MDSGSVGVTFGSSTLQVRPKKPTFSKNLSNVLSFFVIIIVFCECPGYIVALLIVKKAKLGLLITQFGTSTQNRIAHWVSSAQDIPTQLKMFE